MSILKSSRRVVRPAVLGSRKSVKPTPKRATVKPAPVVSKPAPAPVEPIVPSATVERQAETFRYTEKLLSARSAPALKAICKANGWKGYSALSKSQLIVFVLSNGQRSAVPDKADTPKIPTTTTADLKAQCKAQGIKGYSKLSKAELVVALETGKVEHVAKVGSVDWLRGLAKAHGIKGGYKLNKLGLINALSDTDAVGLLIEAGLDSYTPPVRRRKAA